MARPRAISGAVPQEEYNQPPGAGDWITRNLERLVTTVRAIVLASRHRVAGGHVLDDLQGAAPLLGGARQRVGGDDLVAVQLGQVLEVDRLRGQNEDAVEVGVARQRLDGGGGDVALGVGDERERDLPALLAPQPPDLGGQLGEDARVVAAALGLEAQQARQLAARGDADVQALVQAAVEEADPDLAAQERELLGQRQRQAAREQLPRPAHRRAGVDQQVVGQRLEAEDLVLVRQLAWQERVQVPAPLDRGVAVDREALRGRPALGL